MWVRKRIDIGWLDLLSAAVNCFRPGSTASASDATEAAWSTDGRKAPRWQTVDVWFGVQNSSPSMAKSLKRLARVEYAEGRKIDAVQEWSRILADKKLTELIPDNEYVTNQSAWNDLWKAWRPNEKLPEIDFNKHLILVSLGGIYPVGHDLRLTEQGDLRIWISPRVRPFPIKRFPQFGKLSVARTPLPPVDVRLPGCARRPHEQDHAADKTGGDADACQPHSNPEERCPPGWGLFP